MGAPQTEAPRTEGCRFHYTDDADRAGRPEMVVAPARLVLVHDRSRGIIAALVGAALAALVAVSGLTWLDGAALPAGGAPQVLRVDEAIAVAPPSPSLRVVPRASIRLDSITLVARRPAAAAPARRDVGLLGQRRDIGPLPSLTAVVIASPPRGPEHEIGKSLDDTADWILRPEALAREIGEWRGGLVAAYERALRRDPTLAGDVVARLTLDAEGRVIDVTIVSDTLAAPALRRRLVAVLHRWRAPPVAAPSSYELPFHFRLINDRVLAQR